MYCSKSIFCIFSVFYMLMSYSMSYSHCDKLLDSENIYICVCASCVCVRACARACVNLGKV